MAARTTRSATATETTRIERLDFGDADGVGGCQRVHFAAHRADDPEGMWLSPAAFCGWLTVGWEPYPREVWVARDGDAVTGWYRLELPTRENRTRASLDLVVHPDRRRQGIGGALLRHAKARAVAAGRTELGASAWDGSAGEFFARTTGAYSTIVDVRRIQDLTELPPGLAAQARDRAAQAAAGYSLGSWQGAVPEQDLADMAELMNAMADAPSSPGTEPSRWDVERVRTDFNAIYPLFGVRNVTVFARHETTGAIAAITQMWLDPAIPDWAAQGLTVVTREHRGHRLGLLVKAAMLEHLAHAEPQVKRVETWNARDNTHMIAVNEALGYRVLGPPATHWKLCLSEG